MVKKASVKKIVVKKAKAPQKPVIKKKTAAKSVKAKMEPAVTKAKKKPLTVVKKKPVVIPPEPKQVVVKAVKPESKQEKAKLPLVRIVGRPEKKVVHNVVPNGVSTLESTTKERYSKKELAEFREILEKRLDEENKNLIMLRSALGLDQDGDNGTNDTYKPMKLEEDSKASIEREESLILIGRTVRFIDDLKRAMVRILNGTYGICTVTARLISKERLYAVPHATQSIEAKKDQGTKKKGAVTGASIRSLSMVA